MKKELKINRINLIYYNYRNEYNNICFIYLD